MKTHYIVLIILLVSFTGCKKNHVGTTSCKTCNTSSLSNFNSSYNAWLSYKTTVHNSYTYISVTASFTGYRTAIKTSVKNGNVIARDFSSSRYESDISNKIVISEWYEDENHINTHAADTGEALTLDDIYAKARNIWLKADAKTNVIIFEGNNNGLISNCGFVPKGCMDDCFNGIVITSITAL